jgi:hypothetical protein
MLDTGYWLLDAGCSMSQHSGDPEELRGWMLDVRNYAGCEYLSNFPSFHHSKFQIQKQMLDVF